MTQIINPYTILELTERIVVATDQINNHLVDNIKKNLVLTVEKKCNANVFVLQVHNIKKIIGGEINTENFTGEAIYDVTYTAKVCVPILGKQLICIVKQIIPNIIVVENGPIICTITRNNISNTNFNIDDKMNIKYVSDKNTSMLKVDDYVKITVSGQKFHKGDVDITIVGYLDNIASEEEIKKFYQDLYSYSDKALSELFI